MSKGNITVRLAGSTDRNAIYELIGQLGYQDLERSRFEKAFEALLRRTDLWVLIVEDSSSRQVFGFASMSERPQLRLGAPIVTIDEFVISESARGLGIGALLLEEAKRHAAQHRARRLQLDTNRQRESYQRRFYTKHGFSEADSAVMRVEFEPSDQEAPPEAETP